ncbi:MULTISPECIES: hypothetical protein [Herbaspirillum]|uniref:Uncharacterized protein n=2 Tax=Herbaspirillum huttiense TaxID=863372 RepID=A0AAJ2HAE2_9BURK|nr:MULTISPECIES: hypothetical protein [Herbaspirillum]MDR9836841.1 hypothetical protein [Herbaspirillum huttiense]
MFLADITVHWNDPGVQAALISGVFSFFTACTVAATTALIGRQIAGRKKLKRDLAIARSDIEMLLEVEKWHTNKHLEYHESNLKLTARKEVRRMGFEWSGRNTPGKIAYLATSGRGSDD